MMITNPKGWRNRRAAALVRRQEKEARAALNAQRWRAFQGLPPEHIEVEESELDAELRNLELEDKLRQVASQVQANTDALTEVIGEPEPVDPETMENSALRQALEERGYEVPKNTARARLIELYKEKVT
jgi:hypothetical protein